LLSASASNSSLLDFSVLLQSTSSNVSVTNAIAQVTIQYDVCPGGCGAGVCVSGRCQCPCGTTGSTCNGPAMVMQQLDPCATENMELTTTGKPHYSSSYHRSSDAIFFFDLNRSAAVSISTCSGLTDFDTYLTLTNQCPGDQTVRPSGNPLSMEHPRWVSNDDSNVYCSEASLTSRVPSRGTVSLAAGRYYGIIEGYRSNHGTAGVTITANNYCQMGTSLPLLYPQGGCATQGPHLGSHFTTPQECYNAAVLNPYCGSAIMWAPRYNYDWGCRCCAPGGEGDTTSDYNTNWQRYGFHSSGGGNTTCPTSQILCPADSVNAGQCKTTDAECTAGGGRDGTAPLPAATGGGNRRTTAPFRLPAPQASRRSQIIAADKVVNCQQDKNCLIEIGGRGQCSASAITTLVTIVERAVMFEANNGERGTKQLASPGDQIRSCTDGVCSIVLVFGAGDFGDDFTNFQYRLNCAGSDDEATATVNINVSPTTDSALATEMSCPGVHCPYAEVGRLIEIQLPTNSAVLSILDSPTGPSGGAAKLFHAIEEGGEVKQGSEITEFPAPISPVNGKRTIFVMVTEAAEYKFQYRMDSAEQGVQNDNVVKWLNQKGKYATDFLTQNELGSEAQIIIHAQNVNQKPTAWPSLITVSPGSEVTVSLDGSDTDAALANAALTAIVVTLPGAGVELYDQADPSKVLETGNTAINDAQRRVTIKLPANSTAGTSNYAQFSFRVRNSAGLESDPATVRIDVGAGAADTTTEISLANGWSWVSFNRVGTNMDIATVLAGKGFVAGDIIKTQTDFTTYYENYGFFGQLTSFDANRMYAIKVATAKTFQISGAPVQLPSSLAVVAGWNWLPMQQIAEQTDLSTFETADAVPDDVLKSQTDFTQYYANYGWFGTLIKMEPGKGYKLKISTDSTIRFL